MPRMSHFRLRKYNAKHMADGVISTVDDTNGLVKLG